MNNKEIFSRRNDYFSIKEKEITIREEAPEELRGFVKMAFYDVKKKPSDLRKIISRILKTPPDTGNWTEYPNIDQEVQHHLENCEWYLVYDIIEAIIQELDSEEKELFSEEINEYFITNGIGWKIIGNKIETRGDKIFETTTKTAVSVLKNVELKTAKTEIEEAIRDLSRRPNPDITGAIQHSLACLECVAREFTGDRKSTLGDLIRRYPGVI